MHDATTAAAPAARLRPLAWLGGLATRVPLKTKLLLSAISFLAINASLGLFAYEKQVQLGGYAIGIYDSAVIGLNHVDSARIAFEQLVQQHRGTQGPAGDPGFQADLGAVIDQVDVFVERAGSPLAHLEGISARAVLMGLGHVSGRAEVAERMADIQLDLAALVRIASDDGLHARDQVETYAAQSEWYMLASAGISACFVILTSALLGRAILQRQSSMARMAHMSRHDGLTGLANRAAFLEALGNAAQRAGRGEDFGVLCIDLDRFKQVNDTLGHPVGDALLRAVAERLRGLVREVDTVARLGGDEFAVVQAALSNPDNASLLAQRVIDALRAPYDVAGHRVVIGATVGIALGNAGERDVDTLMRNADLALYRAKQEGRGVYRFFEPEMDARAQARRLLELDLRSAIERSEFELFYQPLVSVQERRIVAFEALIRWRHPTRGMVSPDNFVPLAEEIGLIVPIGAWVLRTACQQALAWPETIGVAVNLSAIQFARSDVVEQVAAALRESGLPASRLELEITETVLLHDSDATLATLHALRSLGVRIAMDDFGTGYSSLSYLRSFPFDKLKIDRSFIRDLGETGESAAIVRAIAGMGQSLGIATTAEGVENAEQMLQLVSDGCTELQGYFFGKPCPANEVSRLLVDAAALQAA